MNRKIGVILSYVLMILEVLSTLLLTPFIIRTLGQAEYGVYKLSASIIAYLLLLDLGVGNSVVRFVAKYRASKDFLNCRRFMGVATVFYFVVAIIAFVVGMVLTTVFPTAFAKGLQTEEILLGQKLLFITTLNTTVTLGTSTFNSIIIAYERFDISRGFSILQIVLRIILTIIVLKIGLGSIGIVSVNLLLTLFCRTFFAFFVLRKLKLKPMLSGVNKKFIKEVVTYSSFILLQMIATQLNSCADQVLLGALVKSSSVLIAIYSVGQQIVQYFQTIGSSVTSVLMPGVVKLVESKATSKQLCAEMIRIGRLIFMILAFIFTCFSVYGKQFVILWAGAENSGGFIVALLLMAAYTFILTESIGTQILWAMNEHKEQSILKFAIVCLNVFLTILLIKWNPLIGATIGTLISLAIGDIVVMNIVFEKKIKIDLWYYYKNLFKGIIPSLILSLLCGLLFSLIHIKGWFGFFVGVGIMSISYFAFMMLFGMNTYEKELLLSLVRKLVRVKPTNNY